jgi:hypothetical protein
MIPITDIRAWGNVVPWKNEEQVELVQKNAGPIKDIITGLRTVLAFLGEPKVKQKAIRKQS